MGPGAVVRSPRPHQLAHHALTGWRTRATPQPLDMRRVPAARPPTTHRRHAVFSRICDPTWQYSASEGARAPASSALGSPPPPFFRPFPHHKTDQTNRPFFFYLQKENKHQFGSSRARAPTRSLAPRCWPRSPGDLMSAAARALPAPSRRAPLGAVTLSAPRPGARVRAARPREVRLCCLRSLRVPRCCVPFSRLGPLLEELVLGGVMGATASRCWIWS